MVEQPSDGSVLFGNHIACRFGRHLVLGKISHIAMEGALGYNSILSTTRAMQGKCVFLCVFVFDTWNFLVYIDNTPTSQGATCSPSFEYVSLTLVLELV
ncbi:hypothetical protein GGI42DRAFT_149511 [Trichoderma sp. SZMC 28013]